MVLWLQNPLDEKLHPDQNRADEASIILEENKSAITAITRLRDNRLAHNNAEHLLNPKLLFEKFPLKKDEVEKIFDTTAKILSLLNPDKGHGYVLDLMKEDAERVTIDLIKNIQYFQKKKKEYLDKWVETGEGDHKFPPEE